MNLTFNTQSVDVSVALKALNQYRAAEFEPAIATLLIVLDAEPDNWQARLMLGVCYYRTKQYFAAQWSFRHVYERTTDLASKKMGLEGLQATAAKLAEPPEEFAGMYERTLPRPFFAWLDFTACSQTNSRKAWKPNFSR